MVAHDTAHGTDAAAHDLAHSGHDTHPRYVTFRIARQDKPGGPRYWQTFSVPYEPQMNVISALQKIAKDPVPVGEKTATTPVVWDSNCLEEVCGACSMLINGKVRQACSAMVDNLATNSAGEIELEPMSKFPVLRDLMVDRSRIFKGLKRVRAWIPVDGYHDTGPGPVQSPTEQEERYPLSECMTCGCCMEACPQYLRIEPRREAGESDAAYQARCEAAMEHAYVGPAVISQAVLMNMHPTGEMSKAERIEGMMGPGGITNCVKVCPKNIPLVRSLGMSSRQTTLYSISRWLLK